eukprot:m.218912 g.218912  ORF g.218912 m.218912 type:complete len:221 (+) comp10790_c1_seq10:1149-1811(+)
MPAFLPPPPLDLKRSSVPNVDYSFNSEYSCRRQSIESVESAQSDESWLGDDEVDPMLWQQPFPSQELIDEFVDQSYSIQQEACEESMIRDLFDFLDATHSGKIAIGMIRGHMQGFSPDSAFLDSEIMMLLAGTAVDEEGFIAYEEFSALVRRGLRGQCHPSGLVCTMRGDQLAQTAYIIPCRAALCLPTDLHLCSRNTICKAWPHSPLTTSRLHLPEMPQ